MATMARAVSAMGQFVSKVGAKVGVDVSECLPPDDANLLNKVVSEGLSRPPSPAVDDLEESTYL
jgi:hypothetical protein